MRKFLLFFTMVLMASASITVGKGEVKNGDVVCVGDTAVVEGKVKGDLVAIKCHLTFSGKVNGDLVLIFSSIEAKEGAKVNGDLVNIFSGGDTSAIKVNGSKVKVMGHPFKSRRAFKIFKAEGRVNFFDGYQFVSYLILWGIISILIFLLFQKNVLVSSSALIKNPLRFWLKGIIIFLVLLLLIIIFAILSIIIIGVPFLIILVLLIIGAILFGYTSIFYGVGNLILNKNVQPVYSLLLGMVLFSFLKSLYLVGSLLSLVMAPLAFGITYATSFGRKIPPSD